MRIKIIDWPDSGWEIQTKGRFWFIYTASSSSLADGKVLSFFLITNTASFSSWVTSDQLHTDELINNEASVKTSFIPWADGNLSHSAQQSHRRRCALINTNWIKKVNTLQLSDNEHADDKILSNQGLLISIYWGLIGCGLMNMQPLAGNC